MNEAVTFNVGATGAHGDFVSARADTKLAEAERCVRLRFELTLAFRAEDSTLAALDADSVIARNLRN